MSIQELAKYGRNGDNMLMHVSDREVAGLNALARANGTQLTTNPVTGAPEAFNLVPTLAGIAGGMIAGPWGAAAGSGLATTAQTGSLEQGLMSAAMAGAGSAIGGNLAEIGAGTTDAAGNAIAGSAAPVTPSVNPVLPATPTGGAPVFGTTPPVPTPTPTPTPQFGAFNSVDAMGSTPMPTPTPTAPAPSALDNLTMDNFTTNASNTMAGAKDVFSNTDKTTAFLKANQGNLALGGMGMAGQAALEDEAAQKDALRKKEEEDYAANQSSWQKISDIYGKYGKSPTSGMQSYASKYGVSFKEGGGVDYSQNAKDAIQSKYDRQVREAGPVDRMGYGILDLMDVRDPATLRRALDQYREENDASPARGGSPYAAGGQVGNFNQATGYAGGKEVKKEKSFTDYQPESSLPDFFKYIPDAYQLSDWWQDQLPEKYRLPKRENADKYAGGGYLEGGRPGDGMSDDIPATIDGTDPAWLSNNEYVVPADVVSHIGNGSSEAGAERLDMMLDRIRMARTGTKKQAPEIDADKYLPA